MRCSGRQFAERDLFQPGRQIRRHFLLQPPQEEGPQAPGQPRLGAGVFFPRDGQFVTLAEILRGSQVAGHEKVKNGPEIEHGIFHGRAGKHNPALPGHGFDGLGILGLPVLDVLGLVKHNGVELQSAIPLGVAADEGVACQDDVARGDFIKPGVPVRSMQGQQLQLRGEFLGLGHPVEDQTRRTNN